MAVQTTPAALTAKCLPINLGIPLHLGQRVVWIQAPHATRLGTSSWIQNQPAWKQNGKGKKNVFWILHQKVLVRLLSKNFTGMEHAIGTSAIHPAARTVPQHRQSGAVSLCQHPPWRVFPQPWTRYWIVPILPDLVSAFLFLPCPPVTSASRGVSNIFPTPSNPISNGSIVLSIGHFSSTFRILKVSGGHLAYAKHRWPMSKGFSEMVEELNASEIFSPTPSKHHS